MLRVTDPNNTFWTDFQIRLKKDNPRVRDKVENVNTLIDDTILDFQTNGDANRTFNLLKLLQKEIENLFDNLPVNELKTEEMESLTNICRRFNEDAIIQEVRDSYIEERLYHEEVKELPSLDKKKMSSFVENQFPFGPTKIAQSNTTDTSSPNKREELSPLGQNEVFSHQNGEGLVEKRHKALHSPEKEEVKAEKTQEEPLANSMPNDDAKMTNESDKHTESPQKSDQIRQSFAFRKELDDLINVLKEEFSEHKIDEAFRLVQKLKEFCQGKDLIKEDQDYYNQKLRLTQSLINDVDTKIKDCNQILRELEDEEGYMVESVKKGFAIKYKSVAGQQISLKMEGTIDVPIFNMIALIYEMQGYTLWMPFCRDAKEIKHLSRASIAGWIKYNIPPPIFDREAYIYGNGFDRIKENGSILIAAKSIHSDESFCKMFGLDIPAQSKTTRLDLEYMGGAFYPLGENKIKISIVAKVDFKIKFIPLSIINWVARKAASFLLDRIVKKATNLKGTLWEKKIQENREFYGWLETKINAYLKEGGINQEQTMEDNA